MDGDCILNEDTVSATPRRHEKALKVIIILAVLALGGKMIWLIGITPFTPLARIDIVGTTALSREYVLSTAGITSGSTFFSIDTKSMERALSSLPAVQSAQVFRHFPDRLQIILEGRRAVAVALVNAYGRSVPAFFDSQGVIFKIGEADAASLPIISGISIENPVVGMRLPAAFAPFLMQLEKIGATSPELLASLSEIRINPRSFDGFDLILFPVHRRVTVRINELNEETLRYTLLMVDVVVAREPEIVSIDFRSKVASYVLRGGGSL
ncbi:MAG: FtsQ-type POTRA domain-containing protein [Treponema sp.]|nr:FtsQ-type POTRA domain-containing protein [Treponema sp.]